MTRFTQTARRQQTAAHPSARSLTTLRLPDIYSGSYIATASTHNRTSLHMIAIVSYLRLLLFNHLLPGLNYDFGHSRQLPRFTSRD